MSAIDIRRVFDRAIDACARASGLTIAEVMSRHRWSALPRQVAMWLVREITGAKTPHIAGLFDRHHTTVVHAIHWVSSSVARGYGPTFELASTAIAIMQQRRHLPRARQENASP